MCENSVWNSAGCCTHYFISPNFSGLNKSPGLQLIIAAPQSTGAPTSSCSWPSCSPCWRRSARGARLDALWCHHSSPAKQSEDASKSRITLHIKHKTAAVQKATWKGLWRFMQEQTNVKILLFVFHVCILCYAINNIIILCDIILCNTILCCVWKGIVVVESKIKNCKSRFSTSIIDKMLPDLLLYVKQDENLNAEPRRQVDREESLIQLT